ncbi:MAG: hypothetical protein AB7O32_00010 [Vicinamibacterales bacterium]
MCQIPAADVHTPSTPPDARKLTVDVEAFDVTFVRRLLNETIDLCREAEKQIVSDYYYHGRASGIISALLGLRLISDEEGTQLRRRIYTRAPEEVGDKVRSDARAEGGAA